MQSHTGNGNSKRLAIIGCGRRAGNWLTEMLELGLLGSRITVTGVCDTDLAGASQRLAGLGIDAPVYDNVSTLRQRAGADAYLIASHDADHLEHFRQVAGTDAVIAVEKPVAASVEAAAEMCRLAAGRRAPVLAAHNMRFAPILRRAREMIDDGRMGRIHSFRFHNNVHYGDVYFRRWMRRTQNIGHSLVEKGCHDLDILQWLAGSRVSRVLAVSDRFVYGGNRPDSLRCRDCAERADCRDDLKRQLRFNGLAPSPEHADVNDLCVYAGEIDITDDEICLLRLESGARGVYVQTFYTPRNYKGRVYTLVGTLGLLEIDLGETCGELRWHPRYGTRADALVERFDYQSRNHYNADSSMVLHFCRILEGEEAPRVTVADGFAAVSAAVSAARSTEADGWCEVPTACASLLSSARQ